DGPHRIQQAQVVDEQVGGDQTTAKEHGDDKEGVEDLLAPEVGQGHGVGRQHGNHHRNDGEKYGIKNGVFEAGPDLGIGGHALVGGQGPFAEIKGDALVLKGDGVHK